jgi:class 3 adenylate cyclase/tetratricopeptide (TPR) repeat protein
MLFQFVGGEPEASMMPNSAPYTAYRFGGLTLDLERGALLTTDRRELPLRPKSFALLRLLVENAGRLLSRDAIMEAIWPDIFVSDDNITQSIRDIRGALGADAQQILRTLPRRGYLFASDVIGIPATQASPHRNDTDKSDSVGGRQSASINPLERDDSISISANISSTAETATESAYAELDEKRLEPRPAERRQMTVMACGVVGLAALSACLDPEDVHEVTATWHQCCANIIERHYGFTASSATDGLLAWFGYPQANENDAERAVQAGLAIVEAVSALASGAHGPLQLGVGIATGLVVVGHQATVNGTRIATATGGTLYVADCLQTLAGSGRILIADSTRRLVGSAFELTDLGEHQMAGFGDPTRLWRVERVLVTESRFDAHRGGDTLTPLVGREEELDLLLRRWSQARDGEGQVVLLSGEPGIGKSRILNALRQRLDAQGVQALRFQCSPYYVNSAFWPSIDNLERTLKFARDETTDLKLDKLEALIVAQYGRPLADVRFVGSILSIPCEQRYGPLPMTPQKHKDETLRTLVDLIEATARQQPSVMLFEDAHWADPTTLEVLDLLIDRVRTVPLLVVLTHRPEFQSRWSGQGHVGALNLSKVTRTQSAAMVSALAGGKALPATLLEQILTRTDGVPLFVEELTKSILESGELKAAGDHYEYGGSARSVTIPATLRDSLMARLDRFMPVKEIAQIGAAIGREFSYELIAAVAPLPQAQLDDALARLSESGLAFRRGTPPDAIYTFKHALVQDAAYDSLLKSRRQELHAKIARVIEQRFPTIKTTEPELLAHHVTAAGLAEAAILLWQAAGELASQRMALTEAIAHLNQGLELVFTLPRSSQRDASELGLRSRLGTAWMALKGWGAPEVWTSLHPALALAKSLRRNDASLPIFWGLTINVLHQGRVAEALPWAQETLDLAKTTGDADLLITGHILANICYHFAGEFTNALKHADKVLELYDDERHRHLADILNIDPKTVAGGHASISTWILGYPDRALRLNDEKDAHARRGGHPIDLGYALTNGAHEFDHRCSHDDLRKRAEECERLGRENSLPLLWALMAPISHGQALIREGKVNQAVAALKTCIASWEASGGKVRSPTTNMFLAEAMALAGDLDDALQLLDEQIAQIERPGWEERLHYAEILRLKGWMLSLKGDLKGAERNFLASLDWARRQQAKMWELRTSTSLARLWQSQGKRQDAYELLAPIYDWFTEGFDTKDLLDAKALLTELG